MSLELEVINPLVYPDWDKLVLSTPNHSFFHSSAWARVLHETYKYKNSYFSLIKNNQLSVLIPFMEVGGGFTGKRGVSLPFSDYCESMIPCQEQSRDIVCYIADYGKKYGWDYIEFRDGKTFLADIPTAAEYYLHTLNLSKGDDTIYSSFRDSTKRNIRKAIRRGVDVRTSNSEDFLKTFYELNCMTRKRHGMPPQPYHFFRNIHEHILSKDLGQIFLTFHESKALAGAMFFHFGDHVIFKYGASDIRYQSLRANNLVMWEGIKWFVSKGFKTLSLGRTELQNQGLRRFKMGWGTEESVIRYYRYDLRNESFISHPSLISIRQRRFVQKMPVSILKIIGSFMYRHIG